MVSDIQMMGLEMEDKSGASMPMRVPFEVLVIMMVARPLNCSLQLELQVSLELGSLHLCGAAVPSRLDVYRWMMARPV